MATTKTKTDFRKSLLAILAKIDRPGTFCTSGRMPPVMTGLNVADEKVSLPLSARQAAALKKLARQAPYGKGTRTLVDTSVRKVWEIDADQVLLDNPEWPEALAQVVRSVQSELGLEKQKLDAHLYKLLLYEAGSFFLPHRDGEKLDGMVATLVVVLPSEHAGGELIVRHDGQERMIDLAPDSRFHTQFAAFYADCEHEIRPITSGFRLTLVYNLTLVKSKRRIVAPTSSEQIAAIARALAEGKGQLRAGVSAEDEDAPAKKLAVLLDHEYTQAGLVYEALKGTDRAKASVLFAAARETGYEASLALVTRWISGSAEPDDGYYHRGRRRYDDDDDYGEESAEGHVMGEVYDENLTAEHFSDAEGHRLPFGEIPVEEAEIVSEQPLGEGKPDREDFEGYTGNAGMTLERWYHRAAVMLWPAESRFDVLCDAGIETAVEGLAQMIVGLKKARKADQEPLRESCVRFAKGIIRCWPGAEFADRRPKEPDRFLPLLAELNDPVLIAAWMSGPLTKDASIEPGRTLGALCRRHGWSIFRDELQVLFERTTNETIERHARLLADFSLRKDKDADRAALCGELGKSMIAAIERWRPADSRNWRAKKVDGKALLRHIVPALLILSDVGPLERLIVCVLDRHETFELTNVQMPVVHELREWFPKNVQHSVPSLRKWFAAVKEALEARVATPPVAPTDWRRDSTIPCKCRDCAALITFLKDPTAETLRLPLAKTRRQHLHQIIETHQLDTTHVTEHRGNPHILVCRKTTASYDRALKAHQVDLVHVDHIRKLCDWHEGLPARRQRPQKG